MTRVSRWLAFLMTAAAPASQALAAPIVYGEEAAFGAAARSASDALVQMRHVGGTGGGASNAVPLTGVVLDRGGWIITSDYKLRDDPAATVVDFADGTRCSAKLVARDRHRGLVLFRADGPPANAASLTPAIDVRPGQWAVAVGRGAVSDEPTQAVGVVSAVGRLGGVAVQTDASVSPLNYGGLLVDIRGRVLGVLTPLGPPGQAGADLYDSGIGFAVPLDAIRRRLPTLQSGEDIEPGWLGVTFATADPHRTPATIAALENDSPAAAAGLRVGDRLQSVNGKPAASLARFRYLLGAFDAGQSVTLGYERGVASAETRVTLQKKSER